MKTAKISQKTLQALFQPELGKAEKTQARIIEATIKSVTQHGVEQATYQKIASAAGISRSLVQHYFPEQEDLILTSVKYVLENFQNFARASLQNQVDPKAKLVTYVMAVFEWADRYQSHEKFWFLFYYYSSINKSFREINNTLTRVSHQRLSDILTEGFKSGQFKCADAAIGAKHIQLIVSGALITLGTEDLTVDPGAFKRGVVELCMTVAEGTSRAKGK